jgi:hypothetical protein
MKITEAKLAPTNSGFPVRDEISLVSGLRADRDSSEPEVWHMLLVMSAGFRVVQRPGEPVV